MAVAINVISIITLKRTAGVSTWLSQRAVPDSVPLAAGETVVENKFPLFMRYLVTRSTSNLGTARCNYPENSLVIT
jgi:hypothetical protein